jgi:hypothetical protein
MNSVKEKEQKGKREVVETRERQRRREFDRSFLVLYTQERIIGAFKKGKLDGVQKGGSP